MISLVRHWSVLQVREHNKRASVFILRVNLDHAGRTSALTGPSVGQLESAPHIAGILQSSSSKWVILCDYCWYFTRCKLIFHWRMSMSIVRTRKTNLTWWRWYSQYRGARDERRTPPRAILNSNCMGIPSYQSYYGTKWHSCIYKSYYAI